MRPKKQIDDFRMALVQSGLVDLGWKHQKFTWSNSHSDDTLTKERLDRGVANRLWLEVYENQVEVLTSGVLDHLPLLLITGAKAMGFIEGHVFFDTKLNGC